MGGTVCGGGNANSLLKDEASGLGTEAVGFYVLQVTFLFFPQTPHNVGRVRSDTIPSSPGVFGIRTALSLKHFSFSFFVFNPAVLCLLSVTFPHRVSFH